MDETPPNESGIFSSVTRLLRTLGDVGENRIELFLLEVQEERIRVFDALILLAAGIVCVAMTLFMITFTLVVIFWDTHRLLILTLLTVVYAVAAVVVLFKLHSSLKRWQAFSATLEQIKKDYACFKNTN